MLSPNPDGYQYTFDVERLWRKNLRDNDNDGQITVADGVDPNRNYAEHWGYDNEGSSPDPAVETYRGPSAASEPETQAMQGLIDRIKPKFKSNLHSFGEWLLYPQGWQVGTLDADNPLYVAMAGTDANPAIAGFNPGQSADTLYVTNGETTDYAESAAGTIAFTPELGDGVSGGGFVFPDDEGLVQAEFERVLHFHLGPARSARHPDDPVSPVGSTSSRSTSTRTTSTRRPGPVAVRLHVRCLLRRPAGGAGARQAKHRQGQVQYRIDGGKMRTAPTHEWTGGERYGPGNGNYYHVVSGTVTGATPGDSGRGLVRGRRRESDSFTYQVASDTDGVSWSSRPRTTPAPRRGSRRSPPRTTSRSTRTR